MIPLIGFAPSVPPTTQGAIVDCSNLLPTVNGMQGANTPINAGLPTLASACRGAAVVERLDGVQRVFAGTDSAVYEATSDEWNDVSRSGGYTAGGENLWRFAQFGNATIAANTVDTIQYSESGAFQDISGAPKARIVEVASGFVMAFGTISDAGDTPDGWACSALYNHLDWTPNVATQAANGRLLDAPGEIRAGRKLGSDIVAYKERSIFLGQYVGPPIIWAWTQIPGDVGALSHESVIDIGAAHVFIGRDDFWYFDGTRPVPLPNSEMIRQWFFDNSSPNYRYKIQGRYDRFNALVYWYFPSVNSSGELDMCLVYNTKTQQWGRADMTIQATVDYIQPGVTYEELGDFYNTYDDLPDIPYDSPQWIGGTQIPAVFDANGNLMLLSGSPASSSLTTWDMGDDVQFSTLSEVWPRFIVYPMSAHAIHTYRDIAGQMYQSGPESDLFDGKFDLLHSARWHRLTINLMGAHTIAALAINNSPDGTR